jgi:hypothetical protein
VDSSNTDFSKVFDKVGHRLLLDKMSSNGELFRCLWLCYYNILYNIII